MIDLRQATHYLRDEPFNPPSRASTVEFRYTGGSTGGAATNRGPSSRVQCRRGRVRTSLWRAARLSSYFPARECAPRCL